MQIRRLSQSTNGPALWLTFLTLLGGCEFFGDDPALAGTATLSVGGFPLALGAGDFNGDGLTDLVVATDGGLVQVFHNQQSDTLAVGPSLESGAFLSSFAPPLSVADINGDGLSDAVLLSGSDDLLAILSQRDAPPLLQVLSPGFSFRSGITTGDFNGDGASDVVCLGDQVEAFLNDGLGSFTLTVGTAFDGARQNIITGDFDGDSDLDIATAGESAGEFHMILNDGSGLFTEQLSFSPEGVVQTIAAGDFDGDADDDIAVFLGDTTMQIFRNEANGIPTLEPRIELNLFGRLSASGDFNDDGRQDVALIFPDVAGCSFFTCNSGDADRVSVLVGNADGLREALDYTPLNDPFAATTGDFNGDGTIDIATTATETNEVEVAFLR